MILNIALGILLAIVLFYVAIGLLTWMFESPGSFFGVVLGIPALIIFMVAVANASPQFDTCMAQAEHFSQLAEDSMFKQSHCNYYGETCSRGKPLAAYEHVGTELMVTDPHGNPLIDWESKTQRVPPSMIDKNWTREEVPSRHSVRSVMGGTPHYQAQAIRQLDKCMAILDEEGN